MNLRHRGKFPFCSKKTAVSFLISLVLIYLSLVILKLALVTNLTFDFVDYSSKSKSHLKPMLTPSPIQELNFTDNPCFKPNTPKPVPSHLVNSTKLPAKVNVTDGDSHIPISWNSNLLPTASTSDVNMREYARVLGRFASVDNWIILSLFDMGCADMAVNFYIASLKPFNITNYLFIGQDETSCDFARSYDINCFVYKKDEKSGEASLYLSKDFLRKMNIRTYMILDALNIGYHVLHTDIDMTFLRNPLRDFHCVEPCDVAPLVDQNAYNAGFIFIRNSPKSRQLYMASKHTADHNPKVDDQIALNKAIQREVKVHRLQVRKLDVMKYVDGLRFWELGKRNFASDKPCEKCVVVHGNWMVSMEAKRYRMKEMQWWIYDGQHRYYTCPERRYLTYDNPVQNSDAGSQQSMEASALKSALALGQLLNRTVILPKFHCNEFKKCTLLDIILIRNLDSGFQDKYRESTFLTHPLVPPATIQSTSSLHAIAQPEQTKALGPGVVVLTPSDEKTNATTSTEILSWFSHESAMVLSFHSLYGAFTDFNDVRLGAHFNSNIEKAFGKKGDYRQFGKSTIKAPRRIVHRRKKN